MAVSMDSIVKLPTSKKIAILVVVVIVIIGLYVYAAYLPQREELTRLKSQRDKLVKELNESRAVAKNLEKFKKEVAQPTRDSGAFEKHFHRRQGIEPRVSQISAITGAAETVLCRGTP